MRTSNVKKITLESFINKQCQCVVYLLRRESVHYYISNNEIDPRLSSEESGINVRIKTVEKIYLTNAIQSTLDSHRISSCCMESSNVHLISIRSSIVSLDHLTIGRHMLNASGCPYFPPFLSLWFCIPVRY